MNFKKIIKTVAPFIGTLIGGPFAGIATKVLGDIFCGDENATEKEIEKAVSKASPEQFVKLKEISAQKEKEFLAAGINLEEIASRDRGDARDMQKTTGSMMPGILTALLTLGFFGTLFAIMFFKMQPDIKEIVDIMLGAQATAWIQCISYWFGSSSGSKIKTMLLGRLENNG